MKTYTIFDDFPEDAAAALREHGIDLTIHPMGVPRPDHDLMKTILEEYDCVIIGTSQKITEDMFEAIHDRRIIATASVGLDHIRIPEEKKELVTIINTPKANAQSVAEFTMGCALSCCKRLHEGRNAYLAGKNNKTFRRKPEDLHGRSIGVVGAGNISRRIIEFADFFGMEIFCWTAHPEKHTDLKEHNVQFTALEDLVKCADVISVNLPNNEGTKGIISEELVASMKDTAIFISVSRLPSIDAEALIQKARKCPDFYVCLDIDVDEQLVSMLSDVDNIQVTPHIAGGTVETRKRMFREVAEGILKTEGKTDKRGTS